jgi:hypothetical protein
MDGVNTDKAVTQKTAFWLTAYLIVAAACGGGAGPKVTNVYPDRLSPGATDVMVIECK